MPLRALPYGDLDALIAEELRLDEDDSTVELIRGLGPARARGYLTKRELERICRWKSPRAIQRVRANSNLAIRRATSEALRARSERRRLDALTMLSGVSVPTASAILMLFYPRRYGVLDIRVWQVLYGLGAVGSKPGGAGFRFHEWSQFLSIIRTAARRHQVTPRDIERALFRAHQRHQAGRLYGSWRGGASAARLASSARQPLS
jgi:hypothetical protein